MRWLVDLASTSQPLVVLVCNKAGGHDMESDRVVSSADGLALAAIFYAPFFEVSCKSNINVQETLHELVRNIILLTISFVLLTRVCFACLFWRQLHFVQVVLLTDRRSKKQVKRAMMHFTSGRCCAQ